MPTIPVPNCVELSYNYRMAGERTQTVLNYQTPGPVSVSDLQDLAMAAITEWTSNIRVQVPSTMILDSVTVTDLTTAISPSVTLATGLPLAGTHVGAQLPNNVAIVLTKRTALRGRSYRGRIYHGPLCEPDVTDNAISPAVLASALGAFTQLLAMTTPAGVWEMVVVSRYTGGNPRASGIFTPVTGLTSDGVLDSQRRRLPGRGQ